MTGNDSFSERFALKIMYARATNKLLTKQVALGKPTMYIPMDKLHFSKVGQSAGNVHSHRGQLVSSNILGLKMDKRYYNWTNKTSHEQLTSLYRQVIQPQTTVLIFNVAKCNLG